MTVSQSIIKWLKEFSPDDMKHIDTDRMHGNVNYMLVKEPITNVKKYISGAEIHKDFYQIVARRDIQTNSNCVENGSWMEQLTDWIEERNRKKEFPRVDGADVKKIGVSSPFYMGDNVQNEALYQMTIFIEYMKGAQTE